MDAFLYIAIGMTALTILVGLGAIVNAIRISRRRHSQDSTDRRAVA
jgi:hypothetical protein